MTPPNLHAQQTVEKVTFRISKGKGSAWISHKDRTWVASFDIAPIPIGATAEWFPHSPTIELIHWIYENEPMQARTILRNRIFTNTPLTPLDQGFVKLAAKRATLDLNQSPPDSSSSVLRISPNGVPFPPVENFGTTLPTSVDTQAIGLALVLQLAGEIGSGGAKPEVRYHSDRGIAALLVSATGEILESAANHNATNRTLHAEVNLLRRYWHRHGGRFLPTGSIIYTSLKPCKMCAALIWTAQARPGEIPVHFAQDDPGPMARRTLLD